MKTFVAHTAPLLQWNWSEEDLEAFLAGKCPEQQGGDSCYSTEMEMSWSSLEAPLNHITTLIIIKLKIHLLFFFFFLFFFHSFFFFFYYFMWEDRFTNVGCLLINPSCDFVFLPVGERWESFLDHRLACGEMENSAHLLHKEDFEWNIHC